MEANSMPRFVFIHRINISGLKDPREIPGHIKTIADTMKSVEQIPIIEYFIPVSTLNQDYSLTIIDLSNLQKVEG